MLPCDNGHFSVQRPALRCYSLLEMIKDGYASASKFQGALLRIKTPNMVVVFSNREPRMHSLSLDLWKVFSIRDGKLVGGFEDQIWKTQKDDHTKAAKIHQLKMGCLDVAELLKSMMITIILSSVSLMNHRNEQ